MLWCMQIVYPSLESEVMVGPYVLRLLFPGSVGVDVESVRPARALTPLDGQELLSQLLFRLLGDSNHAVKLACVRGMERVSVMPVINDIVPHTP